MPCDLTLAYMCRYSTNTANTMLASIVSIQPKDSGGSGGETRESVVYKLADDMLEKVPVDYLPHEVNTLYTFCLFVDFGFFVKSKRPSTFF